MLDFGSYSNMYRDTLLNNVIPFWLKNSPDEAYGGYFTCLDRAGNVFDTDKFIWLQCREVWCFAMLYNKVEQKNEWLEMALHGARFLEKYGRDQNGDWYFSLNREGRPLTQPYNIFSDCFAAMAFAQLYKATGEMKYSDIAVETFRKILQRQSNTKGHYSKAFPGTRPLRGFALPMILINLVLEMEHTLEPALVEKTIQEGVDAVMHTFYQPAMGVILENVAPDGGFSDSFEGRLINPGHGLESMWFIMDIAARRNDQQLMRKAVDISLQLLDVGWDKEHRGIFYFLDVKGYPPQQLEWDQKLWWVHIEAIIGMLKGYLYTGDERCAAWFEQLHHYTWERFADKEQGEWFGYLNRRGEVLLPLKGGKWKGCFHVPRGLYQGWSALEAISAKVNTQRADIIK